MLEHHLGNSFMEKEEIDKKTVIRTNWKKLIKQVKSKQQALHSMCATVRYLYMMTLLQVWFTSTLPFCYDTSRRGSHR